MSDQTMLFGGADDDGDDFSPFEPMEWQLAHGRTLTLGPDAIVMGILNVTPDSFSDGGAHETTERAIAHGKAMVEAGADIVDVGGESTRPGASPVSGEEERDRILPVVKALAEAGIIVSVDTYRSETARAAVEAGAHIVNDVGACQADAVMPAVIAKSGAGLVLMHSSRNRQVNEDPIEDQFDYLEISLERCHNAGVPAQNIVLDPGFGFGKDGPVNIALLQAFPVLHNMGFPLLVGTSRKRFLQTITSREPQQLAAATAATSVIARMQGAAIFRVHDVSENVDALAVADAVIAAPRDGETE